MAPELFPLEARRPGFCPLYWSVTGWDHSQGESVTFQTFPGEASSCLLRAVLKRKPLAANATHSWGMGALVQERGLSGAPELPLQALSTLLT